MRNGWRGVRACLLVSYLLENLTTITKDDEVRIAEILKRAAG